MSSATLLVAGREVRARIRSRAYILGTVAACLMAVAALVLPKLLANVNRPVQTVGVVGAKPADFDLFVEAAARAAQSRATTVDVADLATAERQLRSGVLDLVVVDGSEIVTEVAPSLGESRGRLAQFLSIGLALQKQPPVPIRGLDPPKPDKTARQFASFAAIIVMFGFLITYGTWTMSGVAEEKASRVVEILLASMPARSLLVGKVLGIGALALTQGACIAVTAGVATVLTGGSFLETGGLAVIGAALVWFLLGYAMYSCVYAAAASTLQGPEEMSSVTFPVQAPLMASYILCVTPVISGQSTPLLTVLSFIPPTAPIAMTGRIGLGIAPLWQIAVSIGLTVATIALAVELSSRIYERSILRTGQRLKFRQVLKLDA